jgi:hypothetical protein
MDGDGLDNLHCGLSERINAKDRRAADKKVRPALEGDKLLREAMAQERVPTIEILTNPTKSRKRASSDVQLSTTRRPKPSWWVLSDECEPVSVTPSPSG